MRLFVQDQNGNQFGVLGGVAGEASVVGGINVTDVEKVQAVLVDGAVLLTVVLDTGYAEEFKRIVDDYIDHGMDETRAKDVAREKLRDHMRGEEGR